MQKSKTSSVAQLVANQIEKLAPTRTQREIAERMGFRRPNMLSMIRCGRAAIPFEKIPVFARELEIDSGLLLRMHLKEVWPEFGAVVDSILGGVVGSTERAWLEFVQEANLPAPPRDPEERQKLAELLSEGSWKGSTS